MPIKTPPAIYNSVVPNFAKFIGSVSPIGIPDPYKMSNIPTPTRII
jgi:hypothetical protein